MEHFTSVVLHIEDKRRACYICKVYAHDLKSKSLKDIQPQICDSMDSLLYEMSAQDEIQVHYAQSVYNKRHTFNKPSYKFSVNRQKPFKGSNKASSTPSKSCTLCKAAERPFQGHNIGNCWFISKYDKLEITKTFRIDIDEGEMEKFDSDGNEATHN